MRKNVFVLAFDEFTNGFFSTLPDADDYAYHALLPPDKIISATNYSIQDLLEEGRNRIKNFDGSIDAIVSYWDFPATLMLPALREAAGLATTSVESILRCEHKYWSRLVQARVVHELIPRAVAFDPFAKDPLELINLDYPFWVKPVKAHSSILGFRIEDRMDFELAIQLIRKRISRFSDPFNEIFNAAQKPPEVATVNGSYCLAEEIISAHNQCTLEGYVFNGETYVYGVVDSLREVKMSSFSRYHYPSRLPRDVIDKMIAVTTEVMPCTGLDNEPFNIEFFHDPETGRITLLEINPRISKSHCPLFYFVDGVSHQDVMLQLGLGNKPSHPQRAGRYQMATKFMVRRYSGDAIVKRVPTREEITALQSEIEGVFVMLWVQVGDKLSDFADTDSYSFEYANIFVGGNAEKELVDKYQYIMEKLPFEFEPLSAEDH